MNILLLCDFNRKSVNTIIDHVTSFRKYSRHNYFHYNPRGKRKPLWLDLSMFNVIIIHYSIFILDYIVLDYYWVNAISKSNALKILFLQDEYRRVNAFHDKIKELKIDILFTCIPEAEIERVYPSNKLPDVQKVNTLTGYVPNYFKEKKPDFNLKRKIDVGYRARGIGFWWLGELYQEKSQIGSEFMKYAVGNSLRCDISNREEDRIGGKKWVNFLGNCKCTLGTESGASVIDCTGEIERNVKNYIRDNPEASFKEVQQIFLKDYEGKIRMNQISPRQFEAIGCGCCLILFEGEYSNIFIPEIHYIELKKDFSNINKVIDNIKDDPLIKEIAKKAYDDIIASEKYSYKTFINSVDQKIDEYFKSKAYLMNKNKLKEDIKETVVGKPNLLRRIYKLIKKLFLYHPFLLREKIRLLYKLILYNSSK